MKNGSKYKLLVVDIDGTLEGKNGVIAREVKDALSELQCRRIGISLSTGRVRSACQNVINQLSLDGYHIFCNGALVSSGNGDKEIFSTPLSKQALKETIDFTRSQGIYLELATADRYFIEKETEASAIHQNILNIPPIVVNFDTIIEQENIIKENLIRINAEDDALIDSFWDYFKGEFHLSRVNIPHLTNIDFINVVSSTVSKGKALEAVAEHYGILIEEIMAVGDGMNDIPLLTSAGLGVAMGNAPDALKAVADEITLDVEHHGLAHSINQFML
ncbi:MAG: HAD family phosphatase [Dehalococcoidia bacterium]|nr:HAD family phosphatase [Dehalococcoidia bacterium]